MAKLAECVKQEKQIETVQIWNGRDPDEKRRWLADHHFRFADEYSKKSWKDLNRTIRVQWRCTYIKQMHSRRGKKRK